MRARDNPFSTDRVLRFRYRPIGTTWEAILDRLRAMSYRGAIVGPHGSGKTTLLEDLQPRLADRGLHPRHVFIDNPDAAHPFPTDLAQSQLLLLDGAERLSPRAWRRLQRLPLAGLVITAHAPGLLPTLYQTPSRPEILREAIDHLAEPLASQLPDPATLLTRHHGNLRDALRELYDLCAALP